MRPATIEGRQRAAGCAGQPVWAVTQRDAEAAGEKVTGRCRYSAGVRFLAGRLRPLEPERMRPLGAERGSAATARGLKAPVEPKGPAGLGLGSSSQLTPIRYWTQNGGLSLALAVM